MSLDAVRTVSLGSSSGCDSSRQNDLLQTRDPERMVIEALNKLDFLPSLTFKDMLILVTYLNYRLKAVSRKRGRKY